MIDDSNKVPHFKVVVLGNSGCGKTSMIIRWITDQFSRETKPTIGSNHQRKRVNLNHGPVDLFVWDTAGQEQFQALMPLYTRSSTLGIITCAINDMQSFESIPKWISIIKNACDPPPPMILAVNKIDISDGNAYTIEKIHSEYDPLFKCIYFVSALSGENINTLFVSAAEEAYGFAGNNDPNVKIDNTKRSSSSQSNCC